MHCRWVGVAYAGIASHPSYSLQDVTGVESLVQLILL